MGAHPKKIKVAIAGGASMDAGPKGFDIGKRNILAIRKMLWKKGLFIDAEDLGSNGFRNLYLSIHDGSVTVKTSESTTTLLSPAACAAAKHAG
jgi:chemotaxis protein CheD